MNLPDNFFFKQRTFPQAMWEGWTFTRMCITLAWQHHFTMRGCFTHDMCLTQPLFIEVSVPSHGREWSSILPLFLWFNYMCSKLFRQRGIFVFHFDLFYLSRQIVLTGYVLSFWNLVCKSSSLPVDRKYQKGQKRDNYIILLFNSKYKCWWINVIFLQDKHNINAMS